MPTAFAYAQGEDGVGGGGTPKRGAPGRGPRAGGRSAFSARSAFWTRPAPFAGPSPCDVSPRGHRAES